MPEPCNGPGRPPTAASVTSNHHLPPSSFGSAPALSCVAPAATPPYPSAVPTAMMSSGNLHHPLLDVPAVASPTGPVAPSPAPAALAPAPPRINGADSPPPSAPPSSTGRNSMGFQITSVTQSHTSADAVDESGDEECVVDSAPSEQQLVQLQQLASAQKPQEQLPVIPTTDGFGITLVAGSVDVRSSSSAEVVEFPSGIEMDVTPTGMKLGMATAASCCAGQNTVDSWRSRFKVVRIETNLPFRRGRWQCMDYMDQPNAASAVGVTRDGSVASGTSSAHSSIPPDPSGSEQVTGAVVAATTPHEEGVAVSSALVAAGHTSTAASASSAAVSQHQPVPLVQQAATLPVVQAAAAAPQPPSAAVTDVLPIPVVYEPPARVPTVIGVVRQCSVPTSPDTGVPPPSHHQPPPASVVDVHTTTSALSRTALSPSVSVSGISDSLSATSVGSTSLYGPTGSHAAAAVYNSVHGGRSVAASLSDMSSANVSFNAAASDSGYSGGSNNPVDAGKVEPIDNKIEQAMDLVKSHLLLAVREEVDVLKASIARLMDRIGSLERENDILRGSVAPEVLQQLVDVPPSAPAAAAVQTSPVPPALQQPLAPGPSPAVTTAAATSSQLPGPPGGGAL